jgi:hypothetical protein
MPGAYEIPGFSHTLPAGTDFRTGAGQHRFVTRNASGQAVAPAGATSNAIGVRDSKANVGEAVTVRSSGIVLVEASAAIAVGANVSSTSDGRAVTSVATNVILGQAVTAAGAAGALISVQLQTGNPIL